MLQYGLSPLEWDSLPLGVLDAGYVPPSTHAPPLFVHANLLKHSGYNNQRGNTFEAIKYALPDLVADENSSLLKTDIRATVYDHGGMCVDIWDSAERAREGKGSIAEGDFERGRVAIVDWKESWGGMLREFEDVSAFHQLLVEISSS